MPAKAGILSSTEEEMQANLDKSKRYPDKHFFIHPTKTSVNLKIAKTEGVV